MEGNLLFVARKSINFYLVLSKIHLFLNRSPLLSHYSFGGKAYFSCAPNYGGFVSPLSVTVGDFPPEEFNIDDEI